MARYSEWIIPISFGAQYTLHMECDAPIYSSTRMCALGFRSLTWTLSHRPLVVELNVLRQTR